MQLTSTSYERKVTLENKGRRPQQLRWTNETLKLENDERARKARTLKNPASVPKSLMPVDPVFNVSPVEIVLRPRTAMSFIFKGSSAVAGPVCETFVLESKVGKDRNMDQIIRTDVRVDVLNPLLECSKKDIYFNYTWEKDRAPSILRQDITLTNKAAIPLSFVLRADLPFNLSSWDQVLKPEQSVDITVEFDPLYRDDKLSHVVEKSLGISYRGHPQKDSISLKGEIVFPNLKFEDMTVNFGCVLNETEKRIKLKVTNWSKVDTFYNWTFMEVDQPKVKRTVKGGAAAAVVAAAMMIPPNQVFDILPVQTLLKPGESEDVEFIMFGSSNSKFSGLALCSVEGGPEYKLTLQGEASTVSYALDKAIVDFGKVVYVDKKEEGTYIIYRITCTQS